MLEWLNIFLSRAAYLMYTEEELNMSLVEKMQVMTLDSLALQKNFKEFCQSWRL